MFLLLYPYQLLHFFQQQNPPPLFHQLFFFTKSSIKDETRTQDLLDLVFKQLDLNENIFFGLYLSSDNRKNWLINNRRISKQIVINSPKSIARLYFGIKFYIEDPSKLKEETSRYNYYLNAI